MHFTNTFSSLLLLASTVVAAPLEARAPTKRGIGYNSGSVAKLFTSSKIGWGYNWGAVPGNEGLGDKEFVPMCWGQKPGGATFQQCKEGLAKSVAAGAKHILAFNEPDHHEQANMSPELAVQKYMELVQPYADKARLGAPGVTNSEQGLMGIKYLEAFLSGCKKSGCSIDFIPFHWYDASGNFEYFKQCITRAQNAAKKAGYDKPIWVTEFGVPNPDVGVQTRFLNQALPWLDSSSIVERYAYFGALEGAPGEAKMVTGGTLNAVGRVYNS